MTLGFPGGGCGPQGAHFLGERWQFLGGSKELKDEWTRILNGSYLQSLKINGWKMNFLLGPRPLFRGFRSKFFGRVDWELLVFRAPE